MDNSHLRGKPSVETDHGLLRVFGQNKEFYAFLATAKNVNRSSRTLTKIKQNAINEIKKAEDLHKKASDLEALCETEKAIKLYQQIAATVKDFPAIEEDIERVKQTHIFLNDMDQYQENKTTVTKDKTTKTQVRHEFSPIKKINSEKIAVYLLCVLILFAIGWGGYYWHSLYQTLARAEQTSSICSTAFRNNQFNVAQDSCRKSLRLLEEVQYIRQDEVLQRQDAIHEILQSETLRRGLIGDILIDGVYLPKKSAHELLSLKQFMAEAEALYIKKKWQPAIKLYDRILVQSRLNGLLRPQVTKKIKTKRLISLFNISYAAAQALTQKKQWQEAITALTEAQNILMPLPKTVRRQYLDQLQRTLQQCKFAALKEQGDLFFSKANWQQALSSYKIALTTIQDKIPLAPETLAATKKAINQTQLYITIDAGNQALEGGSWAAALEAYRKANSLLAQNQGLILNEVDALVSQKKINRIIFQASLIRDQHKASAHLKDKNLAQARDSYRQIIDNIDKKTLGTEKEYMAIKDEIGKTLQMLGKEIDRAKKKKYLRNNYKSLFASSYQNAIPANMTKPVITFLKETPTYMIFKLQCTERFEGHRPLNLILSYAYNKKTDRWKQIFAGQY